MSTYRDSVLREMGLTPLWRLRNRVVEVATETARPPPAARPRLPDVAAKLPPRLIPAEDAQDPRPATQVLPTSNGDENRVARIAALDWDELDADIRACSACRLCEQRQQAVPGSGDRKATVMFVGEAPGAEEDQRGLPFVGQAGKLLEAMLAAIGLQREEGVYIANTVKCRPPHNRTPHSDEMAACRPYLERQIALIRPKLLVALGLPAAQVLLNATDLRINASRGRTFHHGDIPVIVTYHPAYLLRNPAGKARAWEDLCFVRALLGRMSPDAPDQSNDVLEPS